MKTFTVDCPLLKIMKVIDLIMNKACLKFCRAYRAHFYAFWACLHGGGGWLKNKTRLYTISNPRGAGVRFLEVVVSLTIRDFEHWGLKLTSREKHKINSRRRRSL